MADTSSSRPDVRASTSTSSGRSCFSNEIIRRLTIWLGGVPRNFRDREIIPGVSRVTFLGPDTDAYVASVQRHAAEFEEQTGIALDVRIVPSDLYFSNKIHHLLDGEDAADVYMSGPVLVWEHLGGRLRAAARRVPGARERRLRRGRLRRPSSARLQPLERTLRRPARRRGRCSRSRSTASRTTSPTCRRSSSDAGVEVPTTWDEYFSTAAERSSRGPGPCRRLRTARHGRRGTRCTPASRRSSGRTAAATSRTAVARSRTPGGRRARRRDFLEALRDAGPVGLARPALVRARARLRRAAGTA